MRKHAWFALATLIVVYPTIGRGDFVQTNLVSNVSGLALTADPALVNPWGMTFSSSSPMWVSNQGSLTSTLYNPLAPTIKVPLTVNIQTASSVPPRGPTGTVFNSTTADFQIPAPSGTVKATFLFDTVG